MDEMIWCPVCGGSGQVSRQFSPSPGTSRMEICHRCNGNKKIRNPNYRPPVKPVKNNSGGSTSSGDGCSVVILLVSFFFSLFILVVSGMIGMF